VQIVDATDGEWLEKRQLEQLAGELRRAIVAALHAGLPHLAVALDTARNFVEQVLGERETTTTRRAIARTRAEIALEVWRESIESLTPARHE
jgi:predicted metal-dependent hydrolase